MSSNTLINSIRNYIITCPSLSSGAINVNYLGTAVEYSIDPLPSDIKLKSYTDGGYIGQYQFAFSSKQLATSSDVIKSIESCGFYEDFQAWIESNNNSKVFPTLADTHKIPIMVEVLTSGYLFDSDAENATYQIQLRLLYKMEV
jgi:hypothetical protein